MEGLKDCGRDWEAIARRVITKTGAQCKNFYFNYKKKLQLEQLVAEHESTKVFVFDRSVSSHRYLSSSNTCKNYLLRIYSQHGNFLNAV